MIYSGNVFGNDLNCRERFRKFMMMIKKHLLQLINSTIMLFPSILPWEILGKLIDKYFEQSRRNG